MFTLKFSEPARMSKRPVDMGTVFPGKIPIAKYYRTTIDCDCAWAYRKRPVIEVTKNETDCCKTNKEKIVRRGIINNNTNKSGYFVNHKQYLKSRCMSLDNSKNCCSC